MYTRRQLGSWGEEIAAQFLTRNGDILLARNVRTEHGELDLITRREDRLVFTEVKTRRTLRFGLPEESVTPTKQAHLIASAQAFLATLPHFEGDWQIDVIAVRLVPGRPPEVRHIENAVTG